MEEILAVVAGATNVPEEMILRSARARAKADGVEVEAVLRAWSGGGPIPAGESAPAGDEPAAPEPAVAETATAPSSPAVEVLAAEEPEEAPADTDQPMRVPEPEAPTWEPEERAVAAGAIPRWLMAIFLIVPAVAVLYALFLPNGPSCGDGGRLAVDPATGEAVNCDGSPYGVELVDFFSIGQEEYASCAACHGENGAGAGNFPAFVGGALLAAFPEGRCEDQVEWVRLGTAAWPEPTYGATAKPVGGSGAVMPGFGGVLDEQQLRSVVLYERVQFGGQPLEAAIADCGLGGEEGAGGEDPMEAAEG